MTTQCKTKRKRGGQPGNNNARKHGFYSTDLTLDEICRFWHEYHHGGTDPVLTVLRIKLESALRSAPDNRRVLREASRLLARWYCYRYGLTGKENAVFKKVVRNILEALVEESQDSAGTNQAGTGKMSFGTSPATEPATPLVALVSGSIAVK